MLPPDRSDFDLLQFKFLNPISPQERLGLDGKILTQTLHPLPKSQRRPPASEEALRGDSTKLFLYPEGGEDSPEEGEESEEDPLEGLHSEIYIKPEPTDETL